MKLHDIQWSARPLKLKTNRVWRTYLGGKMIDEWQGRTADEDGSFPEDWVASVVRARNPGRDAGQDEGLSKLDLPGGQTVTLKELIEQDPAGILGTRHVSRFGSQTGVLVKILDAGERLTIQVHPDRETAERLFRSPYGKTEAWYVLGGREIGGEPPYVLYGFKPGITREKWQELFWNQDIGGMLDALNKIPLEPGKSILVKGGIPHAIGPGCFLVEIQEPTDFTIRVEKTTPAGFVIPDELCHQGLGFDAMFDCFHYDTYTVEDVKRSFFFEPVPLAKEPGYEEMRILGYEQTPYFQMSQLEIASEAPIRCDEIFSVWIVARGSGRLLWEGGETAIRQGEQFVLPAGLKAATCKADPDRPLLLIRCDPPKS